MKRNARDNEDSARRISRRALVIGAAQLGVVGALGFRMQSMQIEQADQFRLLAEENRINIRLLPPARGLIFDLNGLPIAANEQNYRVVMVREDAGDVGEVLERLTKIVQIDPENLARAMEEMMRRSPFVPVTIADRLTWDDARRFDFNAAALCGLERALAINWVAKAVNDAAKQFLADRNVNDGAGTLYNVAFTNFAVGSENNDTDIVRFKVQGHALNAVGEFDHFTSLNIVEAVNTGDTVTN